MTSRTREKAVQRANAMEAMDAIDYQAARLVRTSVAKRIVVLAIYLAIVAYVLHTDVAKSLDQHNIQHAFDLLIGFIVALLALLEIGRWRHVQQIKALADAIRDLKASKSK